MVKIKDLPDEVVKKNYERVTDNIESGNYGIRDLMYQVTLESEIAKRRLNVENTIQKQFEEFKIKFLANLNKEQKQDENN